MRIEPVKDLAVVTVIGCKGPHSELVGRKMAISRSGEEAGGLSLPWLSAEAARLALAALEGGSFTMAEIPDPSGQGDSVTVMVDPYLPPPRLIILGGGHIALPLARLGMLMGYRVTVVDDRPEFASEGRFPGADRVVCCSFDSLEENVSFGPGDSVVIVTRGHAHDLDCLRAMIGYPLDYIGMIGSRRKVRAIRDQLAGEGVSGERLDRVHMPIGLDIGAQTPGEIAVSIAAELVMERRGGGVRPKGEMSTGTRTCAGYEVPSEVDLEILKRAAASAGGDIPAALVTIAGTRGSTPRKAGAKMLVYRDGRTVGTIGGGCGESEVRREALNVIEDQSPRLYRVSLDADTAGAGGMICGGVMEVFIEPAKELGKLLGGGGDSVGSV